MDNNASNLLNFKNTCRICLKAKSCTIDLFSKQEQSKNVLHKIFICFQIKLAQKKYLPSLICTECVEELNVTWQFREKCLTSEEKFAVPTKNLLESCILPINDNFSVRDGNVNRIKEVLRTQDSAERIDLDKESDKSESALSITGKITKIELNCTSCNKTLKSEASLMRHQISMHQKRKHLGKVTGFGSTRRYHCTKCPYATPHSQTLINHMRRHNGERPYHCDCGKSFTQSSSLAAHRKTHSTITYYTCSVCGKQFKHAFSLKTHLHVHEIGKFPCSICKKLLKSKPSYQAHMQRHNNIHNYSCEDCGRTFVTCSELINHKKKHNVVKKIECQLCGYKTHAKKNLNIHLKRHAGEKSFKCELCDLSFYTKGDLQRHKRVHTRDKPFSCSTCGQRFTHSPSLNKHMQSVHGMNYKWADVKWKESRKIKLVVVTEKK
ncbi:unnamed protein product [Parnassius mnemosyne]|uniref:Uncharacterized protein n=1 Tax=Parnassius mnemosyne TaxID=213953 RepID=A0AAV1LXG0_9NEOP